MKIIHLYRKDTLYLEQVANLFREAFPLHYQDCAEDEVKKCTTRKRVALIAIDNDIVLGFVGAIPQYKHAWELHPLLVKKEYRFQGIGTKLLQKLEEELRKKDIYTIYLGSDDEADQTTLATEDLFIDTFTKIKNIKNIKHHPYEFYQKNGYQIVGVIPNANGIAKPDIWLAKDIRKK